MRPLPPTLRENRRYLLVKISGEFSVMPDQKEIYHAIRDACTDLFGDAGSARMHVAVVWSEGEHAVIRFTRGFEQQMVAAAAVVSRLDDSAIVFRTVAVSGTIHGVKRHIKCTTWDCESLPGFRCSGKKVDSLTGNNTQQYLTRDDILKE